MSSTTPSTSFTTAQAAVNRNLRGLHLLESDKYPEAISEFSKALSAIKGVLAMDDFQGEHFDPGESLSPSSSSERTQRLVFEFYDPHEAEGDDEEMKDGDSAMPDTSDNSAASELMEDDESPFVFQSPILVGYAATASPDGKDDFASLVKFSAAVLFNLALSYHLAATMHMYQDEEKQKKLLQKALTFYKLAYTMMQDTGNDGLTETMAIANNLGHVQLIVGDTAKARQCYEHLLSTIMFITHAGGDRNAIQHFDGFFQSVQAMVLCDTHHQTAQAA